MDYQELKSEFKAPREKRPWGSGWFSGMLGFLGGVAGLGIVLCMMFPELLTVPEMRTLYASLHMRVVLHAVLIVAYISSVISLALRDSKILGTLGVGMTLLASILGNSLTPIHLPAGTKAYFGLDFFLLNVVFTGILFVPLERLRPLRKEQTLFRTEWREDLFYYFVSSMMVQIFTFLSLSPSQFIVSHTAWTNFRSAVASQPWPLQLFEIMLLTDFVQYWCHRTFHRVPWLWKFHSVHHSAQSMDWMAGARMHVMEILILRGLTVIPMRVMGFEASAVYAYLLIVYFYSTFIHANINFSPKWLEKFMVTPRFHHWHHGIEREAIDVNFAIHFPWLDRLFGTAYMPGDQWPSGYGIKDHPVPRGYWSQFLYPFRKKKKP
jgi:sterol desaturase/sphingolipid hydroxylase (fatty acid hydroxylase superfamily)